ncbi:MAG TPA: enolase C-terminal domain-like protein [Actinomycetota bacterium]|jgi:L-alanine-DL-glutamate epimerase-like enolase superfamily enzyme
MNLDRIATSVYRVPTDRPEADGTIAWDATTMVLAEVVADDGTAGTGWSYTSPAAAAVVQEVLAPAVAAGPLEDVRRAWSAMVAAVRNIGRPGIASTAISAVDVALWDLKARSRGVALFDLLGAARRSVPIYGSGGFTSYSLDQLVKQLVGWVAQGIPRVKMKIGTDWGTRLDLDRSRIMAVRQAIGPGPELFIDANGAYTAKQAIALASDLGSAASYFEEPVSSDQLAELALIRRSIPQDVAAGEYGYDPWYFHAMIRAGSVDIVQADATRCLGVTGFLMAADLAYGAGLRFSAHTSPTIHAHAACAAPQLSHVEYFHDHVRLENMFFDGVLQPEGGGLVPAADRPGLGVVLKRDDAERYRVS